LRAGGEARRWQEGRCIVFDDHFEHEAWNFATGPRIVLIVDMWHPDLSDEEVAVLTGLHSYAAATGAELQRYWSSNDRAQMSS
jgi:aspartyl/asparaginyl beta-hydroxylase (cupin superfamily)